MSLYHFIQSRVLHSVSTLHGSVAHSSSVSLYLDIAPPLYHSLTSSLLPANVSLNHFFMHPPIPAPHVTVSLSHSLFPPLYHCHSMKVWKHHNLRVAYVAQHSFHHVEQHLDSSPVDYMKWRFSGMHGREGMQ